jgi:hypothetical protein
MPRGTRSAQRGYFHLYGIGRADVDHILETFPIVKRKDKRVLPTSVRDM